MKLRGRKGAVFALITVVFGILMGGGVIGKMILEGDVFATGVYTAYEFQDWVYYDPVNGSTNCNGDRYWTEWDKDTTCYRFFMIDDDDNESKSEVRLILDHDVAVDVFENIDSVLGSVKTSWKDYSGVLNVMSENDIASAMKLDVRPTLDNISVGERIERFIANTMYYDNGTLVNNAGWWSSDLYPDDNNYAYTITEYGKNRLVSVTKKRGIRPMIVLDKAKITGSSKKTVDITNVVDNEENKYSYKSASYDGKNYNQLQGFTITDSSLVFYSMINGSNSEENPYGLLHGYTGGDYSSTVSGSPFYIEGGHGNDMAYDSKKQEVLLVGPNNYGSIWMYSAETLNYSGEKDFSGRGEWPTSFSAIAYDDVNDYYVASANSGRRACVMNDNFGMLYSFDVPHDETGQGFGYHNGYLYQISCKNCAETTGKSFINVYNMKFNDDGTPSKGFGRRVARLVIDGASGLGEMESISFRGDEVFVGFAVVGSADGDVFQFRHFDYEEIAVNWPVDVEYTDLDDGIMVTISAEDQLEGIFGYTLSDDGYSMHKVVNADSVSESLRVCDRYDNCTNVNISHTSSRMLPAAPDTGENIGDNGNGINVLVYILPVTITVLISGLYIRHRNKAHRNFEW